MVPTVDQIQALRAGLSSLEPYAEHCVKLEQIMPCRAFFPGGDGFWQPGCPAKTIRTLFLGSDFNNEKNYQAEFIKPQNQMRDSPKTWSGLTTLLRATSIDPDECFFTNAWPCLRKGDYPNSGDPPGANDHAFTARCLAFFRRTLETLQPRHVIPLGVWPTQFVSAMAPCEMRNWRTPKWRSIDRTDNVTLVLDGRPMTFIPAIHPCLPNHRYRSVHKTAQAEAIHIRSAMTQS